MDLFELSLNQSNDSETSLSKSSNKKQVSFKEHVDMRCISPLLNIQPIHKSSNVLPPESNQNQVEVKRDSSLQMKHKDIHEAISRANSISSYPIVYPTYCIFPNYVKSKKLSKRSDFTNGFNRNSLSINDKPHSVYCNMSNTLPVLNQYDRFGPFIINGSYQRPFSTKETKNRNSVRLPFSRNYVLTNSLKRL